MSTEPDKKTSWWATLPGVLTALATTATALAALIAALHNAGVIGHSDKSVAGPSVAVAAPQTAPSPIDESQKLAREIPAGPTQATANETKAKAEIITESFPVERHHASSTEQSSKELEHVMDFYTTGHARMNFSFGAKACSKIRLFVFVDDEQKEETLFFDESAGWQNLGPLSPGKHTLRLVPEGRLGGCNTGRLIAWGGTLTLETTKL